MHHVPDYGAASQNRALRLIAPQRQRIRRYLLLETLLSALLLALSVDWLGMRSPLGLLTGLLLLVSLPVEIALLRDTLLPRCRVVSGRVTSARRRSLTTERLGRSLATAVADRIAPSGAAVCIGEQRVICEDPVLRQQLRQGSEIECMVSRATGLVMGIATPMPDRPARTLADLVAVPYVGLGTTTHALLSAHATRRDRAAISAPVMLLLLGAGSLIAVIDVIIRSIRFVRERTGRWLDAGSGRLARV